MSYHHLPMRFDHTMQTRIWVLHACSSRPRPPPARRTYPDVADPQNLTLTEAPGSCRCHAKPSHGLFRFLHHESLSLATAAARPLLPGKGCPHCPAAVQDAGDACPSVRYLAYVSRCVHGAGACVRALSVLAMCCAIVAFHYARAILPIALFTNSIRTLQSVRGAPRLVRPAILGRVPARTCPSKLHLAIDEPCLTIEQYPLPSAGVVVTCVALTNQNQRLLHSCALWNLGEGISDKRE
jgi:hypothetical protein